MTELLRFPSEDGTSVVVEVDDSLGVEQIAHDEKGIALAAQRIETAFAAAKPAIRSVLDMVRQVAPDEHEIELGLKLTAEAGAIIARTTAEAHVTVRLRWRRETAAAPPANG